MVRKESKDLPFLSFFSITNHLPWKNEKKKKINPFQIFLNYFSFLFSPSFTHSSFWFQFQLNFIFSFNHFLFLPLSFFYYFILFLFRVALRSSQIFELSSTFILILSTNTWFSFEFWISLSFPFSFTDSIYLFPIPF